MLTVKPATNAVVAGTEQYIVFLRTGRSAAAGTTGTLRLQLCTAAGPAAAFHSFEVASVARPGVVVAAKGKTTTCILEESVELGLITSVVVTLVPPPGSPVDPWELESMGNRCVQRASN